MSVASTTKETGSRSSGEIQDAFAQMLVGPEEQTEEDSPEGEQPATDSLDEGQELDAELADNSAVDEEDDGELDEEQLDEGDGVRTFSVMVDGKSEDVPLDELISGYHRHSTFTKKSQALAQERQGFEKDGAALRSTYQQYQEVLGQLQQQMEAANKPSNLDWDALERENPVQWLKLKELERQRAGEIQAVTAERQRMQQISEQEQGQRLQEHLSAQQNLVLEKIPEWADSEIQAEDQRKLVEFGRTVGFTDNELDTIYDHRALIVLRDAMRYRELTNGERITQAKSKIGSARGGNKLTARRTRSRKEKTQRGRLKQSGKIEDAASLMGNLLAD